MKLKELFEAFYAAIISLLPLSPFAQFYETWMAPEWVSWLNWFVPVGSILKVMAAWLAAIALHYIYSVIARWIGLIA